MGIVRLLISDEIGGALHCAGVAGTLNDGRLFPGIGLYIAMVLECSECPVCVRVSVAMLAVLAGVMEIVSVFGLYFFLFGAPPPESLVVGSVVVEEGVELPPASCITATRPS